MMGTSAHRHPSNGGDILLSNKRVGVYLNQMRWMDKERSRRWIGVDFRRRFTTLLLSSTLLWYIKCLLRVTAATSLQVNKRRFFCNIFQFYFVAACSIELNGKDHYHMRNGRERKMDRYGQVKKKKM